MGVPWILIDVNDEFSWILNGCSMDLNGFYMDFKWILYNRCLLDHRF